MTILFYRADAIIFVPATHNYIVHFATVDSGAFTEEVLQFVVHFGDQHES